MSSDLNIGSGSMKFVYQRIETGYVSVNNIHFEFYISKYTYVFLSLFRAVRTFPRRGGKEPPPRNGILEIGYGLLSAK
jgi:hypothetical protein